MTPPQTLQMSRRAATATITRAPTLPTTAARSTTAKAQVSPVRVPAASSSSFEPKPKLAKAATTTSITLLSKTKENTAGNSLKPKTPPKASKSNLSKRQQEISDGLRKLKKLAPGTTGYIESALRIRARCVTTAEKLASERDDPKNAFRKEELERDFKFVINNQTKTVDELLRSWAAMASQVEATKMSSADAVRNLKEGWDSLEGRLMRSVDTSS